MSSANTVAFASTSGTSALMILRARPSAIAVLPTPGSPTSSGLFFCRRHSTWIVRCTSDSRPISGSIAAVPRLLVEVDAVSLERAFLFLRRRRSPWLPSPRAPRHPRRRRAASALESDRPGPLGDAVADVIDGVVARHVLLLQEIGGVALALGEDGDQHIGAGDFLAAGRLHVDGGALDDALEAGGGLGLLAVLDDEVLRARCRRSARRSCAAGRDRHCRRASPRRRRDRRSARAADVRASRSSWRCSLAMARARRSVFSSARENTGIYDLTSFP